MKRILFAALALISYLILHGQYEKGITIPDKSREVIQALGDDSYLLSTTIHEKDLREHLGILASDDFEGRETGRPGIDKASMYIEKYFESIGLPKIGDNNSYYQEVLFTFSTWKENKIFAEGQDFQHLKDFLIFPQYSSEQISLESKEIIFAGYGIDSDGYSDYGPGEYEGKVVMVYDSEPLTSAGLSRVTGNTEKSNWSVDWRLKSKVARDRGVKLLLIVSNDFQSLLNENRRLLVNTVTELGDKKGYVPEGCNTIFISSVMAEKLLGDKVREVISMRDDLRDDNVSMIPVAVPLQMTVSQRLERKVLRGKNMLAYIEGGDKKEEVVIISAHYDHVGKKGNSVYNGADDNASGTTAVLEVVEALAIAKKLGKGPRRSVLCMLLTGEEKGLLGSRYYVENPVFPIKNTIGNVNIDMVGRRGSLYEDGKDPYIYVIGSDRLSLDLHRVNEQVNMEYSQLILDYKYNDEADPNRFYYRSDHFNFARNGIPAIFYFNGTHNDYHKATDTIDKIDFSLMEKRVRHIFHATWRLANMEKRIQLTSGMTLNR